MGKKVSVILLLVTAAVMSGCSGYNAVLKSTDYDAKYELGKAFYAEGRFSNASSILEECVLMLRGTSKAEESVYLLADCYFRMSDWIMASQYFKMYYNTFPNGMYSDLSRYRSGVCLYKDTPDPRLDQSSTYMAIDELQEFVTLYPSSIYAQDASDMIYEMYDRLVEKELGNARLYYKLGNFMGNNYQSGVITAQNALKDFPYTKYREELSILILRCKYRMAVESVHDKMTDRYRDAVDEYYSFTNEFPDSKYTKEAEKIFSSSTKYLEHK